MVTLGLNELNYTRTTKTPAFWGYPAASWLPIQLSLIGSQVKRRQSQSYKIKEFAKIQIFEFCYKQNTQHTFWSCLMRYGNMKWIWQVLLKIQSGHHFFHRWTDGRTDGRTDGQGETSIPPFQLSWSGGYNYCNMSIPMEDHIWLILTVHSRQHVYSLHLVMLCFVMISYWLISPIFFMILDQARCMLQLSQCQGNNPKECK